MQHTELKVHSLAVPQCSSRCRDGNMTTAIYRNTDAVDYERTIALGVIGMKQHN